MKRLHKLGLMTFILLALTGIYESEVFADPGTTTCEPYPGAGDDGSCFRVSGSGSYCVVTRWDNNAMGLGCNGGAPEGPSGYSECTKTMSNCSY